MVGFAVNDPDTSHRADHHYIAVWKMPGPEQVELFERTVAAAGWYDYFDQVNAGGELISVTEVIEDMIRLD